MQSVKEIIPKIYLSGTVTATEYRKYTKKKYGKNKKVRLIDPIQTEDIGRSVNFIVDKDLRLLKKCDILIAYVEIGSTFGTTMEIAYAHIQGIPVYVIDPTGKHQGDVWLKYHTIMFFKSIDECFDHIKEFELPVFKDLN